MSPGAGVSIHRADCPNARPLLPSASWRWSGGALKIRPFRGAGHHAWDRKGLLHEIMTVLAELRSNILAINGATLRDGSAQINVTIEVHDLDHLKRVLEKVKSIKTVLEVTRT